jgi:hypothetical protein
MEDCLKKLGFICLLLLVSCSTLTKKDCSTLNWEKIGEDDGAMGLRKSVYVQHAVKCHKKPDRSAYMKGREAGLKRFCTPQGLYQRGHSGGLYLGECAEFTTLLKDAFQLGRDTYREEEEIKEFKFKIEELENKLKFDVAADDYDERSVIMDDIKILKSQIKDDYEHIKKLRIKAYKRKYIVKEN